ncbi:NUDIX hydrolase [Pseudomonas putida]|uniref:GDP-mannose pyrophosphatase n=1 Tax=Pseudomonas putida TaxID=303 RepID=A0A8I1JIK1_PSEPU|nr:NUDIX hydrolase [Pseudomonas putida]MBI6882609.1 NUDIX hydrolase [Pseudomonas putida]
MNAPLNDVIETVLLETPFFNVVDLNDGTRPEGKGYKVVKEPKAINGAVIIPMLPDGKLILSNLFRRAIGTMSIEFPRGKVDDGENPAEAAIRELMEELGMKALRVKELGKMHSNTSLLSSAVAIYAVSVTGEVEGETDGEVMSTMVKTPEEIQEMIFNGSITDGHTISALMMLISAANQ